MSASLETQLEALHARFANLEGRQPIKSPPKPKPLEQEVDFCGRCGATGHEAINCLAERDHAYAFQQYKQGNYYYGHQHGNPSHFMPHPLQREGYRKPPFIWPPQQQFSSNDKQREEIAELTSLVKALALQAQKIMQVVEAKDVAIGRLEAQLAQVTEAQTPRQPEMVCAIHTGRSLSCEGPKMPIYNAGITNSKTENAEREQSSDDDKELNKERVLDRTILGVRSSENGEAILDRGAGSIRSSNMAGKSARWSGYVADNGSYFTTLTPQPQLGSKMEDHSAFSVSTGHSGLGNGDPGGTSAWKLKLIDKDGVE
ncbi:hypothetical protein RND81_10G251400 [Saponaria officinalis]|uniref:CCHC-type domain-containing protein n=1 Tax=Saponaria officinalis TaxID=3572 RepID=A0AAW1I7H3_SAPOF